MTAETRHTYGFSQEAKRFVHERAGGQCEFDGGGARCENKAEPIVSHLTGVYEATLARKDPTAITDPNLNALMQCELHNAFLDEQQRQQVNYLQVEHRRSRTIFESTRHHRTQRRRYRR